MIQAGCGYAKFPDRTIQDTMTSIPSKSFWDGGNKMSDIKYLVSRANWLEKEQYRLQKELLKVKKELTQIQLKIAKETAEKSENK